MAIRSRKNQYRGLNAHFQSYAQWERDGWSSFHNHYLTYLTEAIGNDLPDGYEVVMDRSLQIRVNDPFEEQGLLGKKKRPEPDVTIWKTNPTSVHVPSAEGLHKITATPLVVEPLVETLTRDEEMRIAAVVIKEKSPDELEAAPVVYIELLSATNKVDKGAAIYLTKRETALEAGIVLVELDFLHETPTPILITSP